MNKQNKELSQILELLNKLDSDVRETNKRVEKWDERYFQLVKEQGSNSRTIINAAASVVVLGMLVPLIIKFA